MCVRESGKAVGSVHLGSGARSKRGQRSALSLRAWATFPSCDTRPTSPFDAPTLSGFCLSLDFFPLDAEGPDPG